MERITLGHTGIEIPELTLGTMTWGTQTSEADAHRQIDMALEAGLTFLDTAEMYPVNPMSAETAGESERVIGNWVRARGGPGALQIATKVTGAGSSAIPGGPEISPARIHAAIDGSLERLGVETLDLYQFHWPNRGSYHFRQNWTYRPKGDRAAILDDMAACLDALQAEVKAGRIRAFGLSNESAWGMAQWLRLADQGGGPRAVAIQNEFSLLARLFDTDLAELCYHEDVTLLAFSPLATGLLTGKYQGDAIPEGSRRSIGPTLGGRWQPRVGPAVAAYLGCAAKHGLDPVHMALAWCQGRGVKVSPIFGATTTAQLAHVIDSIGMRLSDEVLAELDSIHKAHPLPY